MIRLIRIPAPTMNAERPVLSPLPLPLTSTRGKRPVLSPITAIVSPAASPAFKRALKFLWPCLTSNGDDEELSSSGAESEVAGCVLSFSSMYSALPNRQQFRVQPSGCFQAKD